MHVHAILHMQILTPVCKLSLNYACMQPLLHISVEYNKYISVIKCRKDTKESTRIGERIDGGIDERDDKEISERINEGVDERVDKEISEKADGGIGEMVEGGIEGIAGDGKMRCLCARRVEEGEMVCCKVCQRWSHLKCIGIKEGVGLMKGKEFVCHFCLAACMLALQREVEELRKELNLTKSEVKELREENGKLKAEIEHDRSEKVRVVQKEVVKDVTGG